MFSLVERNDSWQNLLTGLGGARDKASYQHFSSNNQLPLEYLENLYLNDDMAARIVDLLPYEMLRQAMLIQVNGEDFEWPELSDLLRDALVKSRVYGAAFIYLGVDDGLEQYLPLKEDLKKVKALRFLQVLTPKELQISSMVSDTQEQNFNHPEIYALKGQKNLKIHHSRLIPFYGSRALDYRKFPQSILQRVYPVLQQFQTAWQATTHLMNDAAQGVFKLKGLHSSMSSNRSHDLLKRMELVDMSRSISRSILLDAEDEDFRRDSYNFGGIPEILDKLILRLSSAAKIPACLLMGQAPAGLNATGDADIRFFYDQVRSEQEALVAKITRLIKVKTLNPSADIKLEFPSLWQMTEKEKAELRKIDAETDRIYLQEGVLLPEEVAIHRFDSHEFNIDLKSRADLAKIQRSEHVRNHDS